MPTQNIYDLVDTWNAGATTFTAIKMNVTDTASAAGSLLMDLQVGGSSRFKVAKTGSLTVAPVDSNAPCLQLGATNGNILMTSRFGKFYFGGSSDGDTAQPAWFLDAQITTLSGRSGAVFGFSSAATNAAGTLDTILTRRAAANLRLGAADAAAPVAQTLSVQSVVAGTTNTAGANLTITGSQGTGTGAGGSIVFQVAPAGSSGTAQNALATALTIDSGRRINLANMGSSIDASIVAYDNGAGVRSGFYFPNGGGDLAWTRANTAVWGVGFLRCSVGNTSVFSWSSTADPLGTQDLILARDAANTLALRNGANNQELRVYGSYTSASVYDRLTLKSSSTVATIAAETDAGDMDLALAPAGSGNVQFGTHAAVGAETVTGYITIKDAGGTLRKLAVIS